MNKYCIVRPDDVVLVLLLINKNDKTYSFINLTKGHICSCRFNSIEDAENDLNAYIKLGKVEWWKKI